MKILLIEDNPDHQLLIAAAIDNGLGEDGQLSCVDSLAEGISQLESGRFDLCLCDLSFPGSHAAKTIDTLEQLEVSTPLVVLTSLDDIELETRLIRDGIQDYLPKSELTPRLLAGTCRHAIERRKLVEQVEELARLDPLTGIANRREFDAMISHHVSLSARSGQPLSLCLIDVDLFKEVNDRHGHQMGDAVLVGIGNCLNACCRDSDIPARLGGDEFAVILPGCVAQNARIFAARVQRKLGLSEFTIGDSTLSVTISVGISDLALGGESSDLLQRADVALYKTKESGRDGIAVYDASATVGHVNGTPVANPHSTTP